MVRRRVIVEGRVQGVFFRDSCRERAVSAGVAGWVRNRPDGNVEAVFEGEPDAVDRIVRWCHEGPRGAVVTNVSVKDEDAQGDHGFSIR